MGPPVRAPHWHQEYYPFSFESQFPQQKKEEIHLEGVAAKRKKHKKEREIRRAAIGLDVKELVLLFLGFLLMSRLAKWNRQIDWWQQKDLITGICLSGCFRPADGEGVEGWVSCFEPSTGFEAKPAVEDSNRTRTFVPQRVDLKARKEDLVERPELHSFPFSVLSFISIPQHLHRTSSYRS